MVWREPVGFLVASEQHGPAGEARSFHRPSDRPAEIWQISVNGESVVHGQGTDT